MVSTSFSHAISFSTSFSHGQHSHYSISTSFSHGQHSPPTLAAKRPRPAFVFSHSPRRTQQEAGILSANTNTIIMRFLSPRAVILVTAAFYLPAAAHPTSDAEVRVTGNPHGSFYGTMCALQPSATALDLSPENVHLHLRLPLQADTAHGVKPAKIRDPRGLGSFRAPVYEFRQSPRIVEEPLLFKLLLLKSIASPLVHEVDVEEASDSWYPGYQWSILMLAEAGRPVQHLGRRGCGLGSRISSSSSVGQVGVHFVWSGYGGDQSASVSSWLWGC